MLPSWLYDVMYRFGAPWEIGARSELVGLVESGRLTPDDGRRAIDLGCGSGANSIFLAEHGWDVTAVDFSMTALGKAQRKASAGGVHVRWMRGDLTLPDGPQDHEGAYDLLVDYGTLDDLVGKRKRSMARLITRLAAPDAKFLMYCFYADPKDLPRMSFDGPSKAFPGITPGEEDELFAADWEIERLPEPPTDSHAACFLMTKR